MPRGRRVSEHDGTTEPTSGGLEVPGAAVVGFVDHIEVVSAARIGSEGNPNIRARRDARVRNGVEDDPLIRSRTGRLAEVFEQSRVMRSCREVAAFVDAKTELFEMGVPDIDRNTFKTCSADRRKRPAHRTRSVQFDLCVLEDGLAPNRCTRTRGR